MASPVHVRLGCESGTSPFMARNDSSGNVSCSGSSVVAARWRTSRILGTSIQACLEIPWPRSAFDQALASA